jgi:hypothetical protein
LERLQLAAYTWNLRTTLEEWLAIRFHKTLGQS